MAAISYTTEINAPIQAVFDVVTDLQSYTQWLPDSAAYPGTTEVSESPVKLGTTYIEASESGLRTGKGMEFSPPSRVVFHQPMTMNPASDGVVLDITVEVLLKENQKGVTTVQRNTYLGIPEPLQPSREAIEKGVAEEGARTMNFLKQRV